MKTMKLIYPLAFALAITLATTGCKHKPTPLTPIPGMNPPPPNITYNPPTRGPAQGLPINPIEPAGSQIGGGPLASLGQFEGMTVGHQYAGG